MPPATAPSPPTSITDSAISLSGRSSDCDDEEDSGHFPGSPDSLQAVSGSDCDLADSLDEDLISPISVGAEVASPRYGHATPLFFGSHLRMRAFLEHLLETGEVHGLKYVSAGGHGAGAGRERVFQMPWKHAKCTTYDPNHDSLLFRLWGVNTGRIRPGEEHMDNPIWKVNFRCALRNVQNTVVEIGDGPVDGDYKTFQFKETELTEPDARAILNDTLPMHWPLHPQQRQQRQQQATTAHNTMMRRPAPQARPQQLFLSGDAAGGPAGLNLRDDLASVDASSTAAKDLDLAISSVYSAVTAGNDLLGVVTPQSSLHPAMTSPPPLSGPVTSALSDAGHTLSLWPPSTASSTSSFLSEITAPAFGLDSTSTLTSTAAKPATGQGLFPFLPSFPLFCGQQLVGSEGDTLVSYEMYVKVAYRGSAMAAMRVAHHDGCRLFYGSPPARGTFDPETQERLFGSRKLMQLSLPAPRTAQSLIPAMWILLESTQRGLVLQMENNDIYVTRLCSACIYYATQSGEVRALERGMRTRVFSFQTFQETYKRYKHPHPSRRLIAAEAPCYEVLMGVGQHWGADRHRDNNLISLNITHSLGEKLLESLRQEFFKNQNPFDTDYMSVDEMDADDKRARAAVQLAVNSQIQTKSLETVGPQSVHASHTGRSSSARPVTASMRKSKDKRGQSRQAAARSMQRAAKSAGK